MDFKLENCVKLEVKCCTMEFVMQDKFLKQFVPTSHSNLPFVRSLAGIVTEVGSGVSRLNPGDKVVGILPLDSPKTIEEVKSNWLEEYFFVLKPKELSFEIATSCILDGVSAYTALHYQGRVRPGDTVLICNAETSEGVLMTQLALSWGAKVLLTTSDDENAERLRMTLGKGVHVFGGHQLLKNLIMDETGGLGVDCIIDRGVIVHEDVASNATQKDFTKPTKYDILSSLAVNGRWVTRQSDLQIDPPDSQILFLKGASVGFLFCEMWLLSTFQQGRYLHILQNVLEKALSGAIRPHLMTVLPASELKTRADKFSTNECIVLKI